MLNNLFLLNFNESLESYIFNLIQNVKINKIDLFIKNMIIALIDHDRKIHNEKNFSFKSMIIMNLHKANHMNVF
jgi:CRISPR/Cas system CMR-associated protein Cmr1 (group 7 of RAMP superfamily)